MKKLKRLLASLLLAIVAICAVGAFTACGGNKSEMEKAKILKNDRTILVIQTDASAQGESTLIDYLKFYEEQGTIRMTFEGGMITMLNGEKNKVTESTPNSGAGSSWMIYTSCTKVNDVVYATTDYGSYDYNGKTLASAAVGADSLDMFGGETYVLVFEDYVW